MNHRAIHTIAAAGLVLGLATIFPSRADDDPKLTASYQISDLGSGGEVVSLTFSFALRAEDGHGVIVDSVILADPATADVQYASFDGGTVPAEGELKLSSRATVPASELNRWESGSPATLIVTTQDDWGVIVRSRVDAYRSNAGR
jgi:hypothetical protein